MSAPQVVLVAVFALGVGIAIADHGKPKTGTNNAWATIIGTAITAALLWWGGFWS